MYYDPVVGRFISKDPVGFDPKNLHSFNLYAYANNNPYRYSDPNGLWATAIHQSSIDRALSGAPSGDRGLLKFQQEGIDANQANDRQFMHSMRIPGQSPSDAWATANSFVRNELILAREHEAGGQHDRAMRHFGNALHTMQDATSPSHAGFQEWDNNGSTASKGNHIRREMVDPGAGSTLDAATARAWNLFKGKEAIPTEILPRP